ncbi:MAG: NAD(P)-dependent oxidoreductase [Pyrinomonadaceae bacterium MAG19_C2-C3]|nr:NAD(P)-dependent oxidoreductase [Pyrinomonadaceae bacterium MAG19_C2-C3]
MSYLITGGSGCIGSYVIRDLLAKNLKVVNYDFDARQEIMRQVVAPEALSNLVNVTGDVADAAHFARTVKEHKVHTIIHLASLQIPASNANPPLAERVIVGGLVNVLETARLLEVKKVVWASSVAVFGLPEEYDGRTVANDAHHRPQSVYGACKSLGEFLLSYYHNNYGINAVGLRYTAVYGVGRERGLSSFSTEMIRKAAAGEDYEVPFGDDTIDWQYVEDVSRLTLLAADTGETKTRIFNTGGELRPVSEAVAYLQRLAPDVRLTVRPGKFGIAWDYDTSPLIDELGFRPEYSMEQGIHRTFNLYRQQSVTSVIG